MMKPAEHVLTRYYHASLYLVVGARSLPPLPLFKANVRCVGHGQFLLFPALPASFTRTQPATQTSPAPHLVPGCRLRQRITARELPWLLTSIAAFRRSKDQHALERWADGGLHPLAGTPTDAYRERYLHLTSTRCPYEPTGCERFVLAKTKKQQDQSRRKPLRGPE